MSKNKLNVKKKCLGKCIESGEMFLHPITLQLIDTKDSKNNQCPTKFYFDEKIKKVQNCNSDDNISNLELSKFMSIPYLNVSPDQFLNVYNIDEIDSLKNWIDNNIKNKKSFNHVNRVLDAWIRVNYDFLIKSNAILENIYYKIFKNYWNDIKINDSEIKKELSKYIPKWFEKKDINNFYFSIGNDINKYLSKKYGKR